MHTHTHTPQCLLMSAHTHLTPPDPALLPVHADECTHMPLLPQIPRSCQCMLMSATVSEDVERLQKLVLHNPVQLNMLSAGSGDGDGGVDLAAGSGVAVEIEHWDLQVRLLVLQGWQLQWWQWQEQWQSVALACD